MRISTSQMYYHGRENMLGNQYELVKTQNSLASGRRILTPKDDPVGSSRALVVTQNNEVNSRYLENQGVAKDFLSYTDSLLGQVSGLLQGVLESALQGGNASYSPEQKGHIAEKLKGDLQNLIGMANGRDASGNYIFGGYESGTAPFGALVNGPTIRDLSSTSVPYNGDGGRRVLQVEASQNVELGEVGSEVFMRIQDKNGNVIGKSVFDALQNMINYLDPGYAGAKPASMYSDALGDLQSSLSHIDRARATVGARLNMVQSLNNVNQDLSVQYQSQLADIQELDYTSAITKLNQLQIQLQASQQSFMKVSELRLFNFI